MAANDSQEGGVHYVSQYQHWDFVQNTRIGYLEGTATKYIARALRKNGAEDYRKSIHYIDKLMEEIMEAGYKGVAPRWGKWANLTGRAEHTVRCECASFIEANNLSPTAADCLRRVVLWCYWGDKDDPWGSSHPVDVLQCATRELSVLAGELDAKEARLAASKGFSVQAPYDFTGGISA